MSCVCILTPMVIAAWPAFSAAVSAAAVSMGYSVVEQAVNSPTIVHTGQKSRSVQLEMPQSEIVTGQLGRDKQMVVQRDGVSVTFARDARGKASLCVEGTGHTDAMLQKIGEELSGRVIQHYARQRLIDELGQRGFLVVEDEVTGDQAMRLKVRRWES